MLMLILLVTTKDIYGKNLNTSHVNVNHAYHGTVGLKH